jgi:hypothetical protein
MAATRRTQLLMEPDEFRSLREIARRRKTSVGALIRAAVRQTYLQPESEPDRKAIVEEILKMRLPLPSWKRLKKEIEDAHADVPGC